MAWSTIGQLIVSAFGLGWGIAGAFALRQGRLVLLATVTTLWGMLIALRVLVVPTLSKPGAFDGVAYGLSVAFEVIGISVAVVWLIKQRVPEYIMPAIAIIVGLHFVGLWRAFSDPSVLWIAAGLCIVGAVAVAVPRAQVATLGRAVTGFGCSAVLWTATAISVVRDVL